MQWWNQGIYPLEAKNSNFSKIIDFYLFQCPVYRKSTKQQVSVRGKTFESRKIADKKLRSLLIELKKSVEYYECVDKNERIEDKIKTIENSGRYVDKNFQMVVFHEDTDLGKTKTIFYVVRNALAHGAFSVTNIKKEKVYYFENSRNKTVKAQIRIKESTLLYWIDLVEKYTS